MANLGPTKISSNYSKLLQQDTTVQDGSGTNVSLNISGHITASGNISSSGTVTAGNFTTGDGLDITGHITASGNISASGAIIGSAVSASKVYAADGFYHSDDVDENTYLKFPTGDKFQLNAGDVNFIYAHQVDADVNKLYFNEDNTDTDIVFRGAVGSNNKLLYLDASAMKIGIGTGVPSSSLHIDGDLTTTHITASGNISASGNLTIGQWIYHGGEAAGQTGINMTEKRFRFNAGGISYLDMNDNAGPPRDITFNDGSNNVDLTIKGSSNNPLFKTDASNNRIGTNGIGTPLADVHMGGNLRVDGSQVDFANLPTSDPGVAGRLWNDSNTVKVSVG